MKTSAMLTVIGLGLLAAEHGLAQMGSKAIGRDRAPDQARAACDQSNPSY